MAVSNEILGVQAQNIECASVQFYQSVHFKCAHKILNLYLYEILTKKVIIAVKIYQFKGFSVPYSGRNSLGLNLIAHRTQRAFIDLL